MGFSGVHHGGNSVGYFGGYSGGSSGENLRAAQNTVAKVKIERDFLIFDIYSSLGLGSKGS